MALSQREKELVTWGRENGKSMAETLQALSKLRQEESTPTGKTGVGGFALGAVKQLASDATAIAESPLNPLPFGSEIHEFTREKLGITDESLEPQSEAERAGAKTAFASTLASGGLGIAKQSVKKFTKGGTLFLKNKADDLRAMIAPKTTGKQGQKLVEEGRVVQGRFNPLTGKAKDVVLPDATLKRAEDVIIREVPDYSDSFKLADDLDKLAATKARELKPQLQAVKTTDEGRDYLISEWDTLKKVQKDSDLWEDAVASNVKFQNKFQKFVDEALEADNLDDLWDIRKRYDQSVPKNIKNPSPSASPSVQTKNEMWLQNRSILNDIIEGTADDLDVAVRGTWDDMSAVYDARNNIISKARIDLKGKQGVINPRNTVKFLLTSGAGVVGGAVAF